MKVLAQRLLVISLLLFNAACASLQGEDNTDPFEKVNRAVFVFNDGLDKALLAPVARGYHWLAPSFVERGVGNFFANLRDLNGAVNAILQGRLRAATRNSGRFIVNSTFGLLGLVDVASAMGIASYKTDFGHTLAIWGVDSGPYLMLPLFGPRSLRSGAGTLFDSVASLQWQLDAGDRNSLLALELINNRAALGPASDLISGDRYIFVRDAYLQQRKFLVNDGVIEDSFSDFDDEDWDE